MENTKKTMRSTAGNAILRIGREGAIILPPEAVENLCLKEGDELECIYGRRQIGLCPISNNEKSLFFYKIMFLLL